MLWWGNEHRVGAIVVYPSRTAPTTCIGMYRYRAYVVCIMPTCHKCAGSTDVFAIRAQLRNARCPSHGPFVRRACHAHRNSAVHFPHARAVRLRMPAFVLQCTQHSCQQWNLCTTRALASVLHEQVLSHDAPFCAQRYKVTHSGSNRAQQYTTQSCARHRATWWPVHVRNTSWCTTRPLVATAQRRALWTQQSAAVCQGNSHSPLMVLSGETHADC